MTNPILNEKLEGLLIKHVTKDATSKDVAQQPQNMFGWQSVKFTPEQWAKQLEFGYTLCPGKFHPKNNGKYTHSEDNWEHSYLVFCDGDNFIGEDDATPTAVESWTERDGLFTRYPSIREKAFAITESVSSMSAEKPHRRYRLIFLFDKPICSGTDFRKVQRILAAEFPLIPTVERQPAQPVFGNARPETGKVEILGNHLSLDAYLNYEMPKAEDSGLSHDRPKHKSPTPKPTTPEKEITLDEFIREHGLSTIKPRPKGGHFVQCPWADEHSSGKNGDTDAYIWENPDGTFAFNCSHATCKQRNRTNWSSYREAVAPKRCEPTTSERKFQFVNEPPKWTEDDIQREENTPQLKPFPEELFFGPFKTYREAHIDKVPMSDAFCFASLKHAISSLLGRKYFIKTTPTIFPNMFTALIGDSSDSAKGIAISQSVEMLRATAPSVHRMNSLATAPGLMNMFTMPKLIEGLGDDEDRYIGGVADKVKDTQFITDMIENMCDKESIRNSLYLEEFSTLLAKANTINGSGLLQAIMELYDARNDSDVNTKVDALTIQYPTFSMIASSDKKLIEKVMGQEYISGGFTNRFEWYLGHDVESFFLNKEKNQKLWNDCVIEIGKLRNKFDQNPRQIGFTMSDDANEVGEKFHQAYKGFLRETQEDEKLASDSLKRTKAHVLKNSLIFAILNNEPDNTEIGVSEVELAIKLSEWTTQATQHIFDDFALGENSKIRQRIISTLTKTPRMSAKVLINKLKTEDTGKVFQLLDKMLQYGIIMKETPKRTALYSVIKEDAE